MTDKPAAKLRPKSIKSDFSKTAFFLRIPDSGLWLTVVVDTSKDIDIPYNNEVTHASSVGTVRQGYISNKAA